MECQNTVLTYGPPPMQEVITKEHLVTTILRGVIPTPGTLPMPEDTPVMLLPPKPPDLAYMVQIMEDGHTVNQLQPHNPTKFAQANKVHPLSWGKLAYQEIASIITDNLENLCPMPFPSKLRRDACKLDYPQQLARQQWSQPIKILLQLDSVHNATCNIWPTWLFWTDSICYTSHHSLEATPPLSKLAKELGAQFAELPPSELTSRSVLCGWCFRQPWTTLGNIPMLGMSQPTCPG